MFITYAASALLIAVGVAMLVAGPVLVVQGRHGRREIRGELTSQKITFPTTDDLPDGLAEYSGQRVETGPQARAFADLIKANLARATGGRTYSEVSADLLATGSGAGRDAKLTELRHTAFQGESLRASLMSAYQAWSVTTLVTALGALLTALGLALLCLGAVLGA